MKLVRFGQPGREKPGIVDASGGIRDLSNVVPDIASAREKVPIRIDRDLRTLA